MPYAGGYYLNDEPLVRTSLHGHTAALENPFSGETLEALNAIQRTPWRINQRILGVMQEAWGSGMTIAGLPSADVAPPPARFPDHVWAAMSAEAKTEHKTHLSDLHAANASADSERFTLLDHLSVAAEVADRDAIWFPHSLDFRGRIYPIASSGPHPQADGRGRALLEFAEGLPLGDTGLYWLCVRAAGCYGMDKLPLDERVEWVGKHLAEIDEAAADPIGGTRWWAETDEDPWGFLATCFELSAAFASGDTASFVSHLPVPLDGTCNGLQHLSAMGRDPIGAVATNLTSSPDRQDIYVEVAKQVAALVSEDALKGDEIALTWVGKIDRKTVKRAVMTTPYGVTARGIRDQLLSDGHVGGERMLRGKRADYLRDKIADALMRTIQSAREIMAWLQACAAELARHGAAVEFTTPSGSRIRQSYHNLTGRQVETLVGRVTLWAENPLAGLDRRKQSLASAPNIIHAFDAAHLTATVNSGVYDGLHHWCMIHDSFGTHAANTTRLNAILRSTFVEIYAEVDWLERLEAEFRAAAPTADLPPRPKLGEFDVRDVLNSPFFFS